MPIRAVIFDLDGLIVDSEPLHQRAFNTYLERQQVGYQFGQEEYAQAFVGIPVRLNAKYLIERFGLTCTVDDILAEREAEFERLIGDPTNLHAMDGIDPLIDWLDKERIVTAVASASPRNQVETMLTGLGLRSRFSVVVTGSDVPHAKPAPDVYLRAVDMLGVAKQVCIAVEDSATGIEAATAAGLFTVAIPNQYTARQNLAKANIRLGGLLELRDYIKARE